MATDDAVLADGRIRWLRRLHRKDVSGRWFLPLSAALLDVGFIDDAIATLLDGLSRDASCLAGWVILGRCYLATGRLEESQRLFELVASRDPDNAIVLRGLAEIHRRTGERARAADHYRALLRLMPWDLEAQKGLAQVLGSTSSGAVPPIPPPGRRARSLPRELAATIGAQEALAKALIPGSPGSPPTPVMPAAPAATPTSPPSPPRADLARSISTTAVAPPLAPLAAPLTTPVTGIRISRSPAPRSTPAASPAGADPLVPSLPAGAVRPAEAAQMRAAAGEEERLRPEPRPTRGIFEAPPADLDAPPPAPRRRSRRKTRRTEKRPGPQTMGSFMRWVDRVSIQGVDESEF